MTTKTPPQLNISDDDLSRFRLHVENGSVSPLRCLSPNKGQTLPELLHFGMPNCWATLSPTSTFSPCSKKKVKQIFPDSVFKDSISPQNTTISESQYPTGFTALKAWNDSVEKDVPAVVPCPSSPPRISPSPKEANNNRTQNSEVKQPSLATQSSFEKWSEELGNLNGNGSADLSLTQESKKSSEFMKPVGNLFGGAFNMGDMQNSLESLCLSMSGDFHKLMKVTRSAELHKSKPCQLEDEAFFYGAGKRDENARFSG
mmetsp:Transcript_30151/g.42053  ORF Transcript_30151/g.42053 Transcript_30151/m.42053 type:complete len:258 (-) Transcript_30151:1340-2113(-)